MPYVTAGEGNSGSIDLYDEDHGSRPPAVLIAASSAAAVARSATRETDFRVGLRKIDVPVLVVQGDADQAVPLRRPASAWRPPSTSTMSLPDAGTVRWRRK